MRKNKPTIYIFSHNVEPNGISGGETILIETFKRLTRHFKKIVVYTWQPGKDVYVQYGLQNVTYRLSHLPILPNFYLSFILRILYGFWLGLTLHIPNSRDTYLYFSSDFWPDALPVILLKLRFPKAIFLSNFYLAAPNPFYGFDEQKKRLHIPTLRGLAFYIMQKPVYWFSQLYADFIFITSEPDVDRFSKQKANNNFFVVKGGVNVASIEKFKKLHHFTHKKYDAVFMGRFHPQKGVLELLDIWKEVVRKKTHVQLIMIGDGQLMGKVKEKIKELGLEKNAQLAGYIFDAPQRYTIFNQSKIVLHPAVYDSGGMAAAEAMAFGIPAVSFDLLALKTYYPKGMIKVVPGNKKVFAQKIVELLQSKALYNKTKKDALALVREEWDWDKRAKMIGEKILSL